MTQQGCNCNSAQKYTLCLLGPGAVIRFIQKPRNFTRNGCIPWYLRSWPPDAWILRKNIPYTQIPQVVDVLLGKQKKITLDKPKIISVLAALRIPITSHHFPAKWRDCLRTYSSFTLESAGFHILTPQNKNVLWINQPMGNGHLGPKPFRNLAGLQVKSSGHGPLFLTSTPNNTQTGFG